ncbi:MAG: alpha/beta hydrolase [Alphaproteobacteria bacterium]|nr:alpha/beta hydrolase [Alphaproteobacteria bacterium]MCB9927995.1 alpha/beta hydrolase [Alphaproteobacteria bacterium]
MPFFEHGQTRIHYQEAGSGFPLLVIPGGGLNGTMAGLDATHPFNPLTEFADEYRVITLDTRNANAGQTTGPLEIERPWDSHTDDQLALLDHLGVDRFLLLGFCIGGPMNWNMLKRVGDRVVAAVMAQPSGHRASMPDQFFQRNITGWAPGLCEARDDVTMADCEAFLSAMYRRNPDFVYTVSRDFVSACRTPVLVLPDDIDPHPYEVAMEVAMLAPNSQVSLYPWKDPVERIPLAVRHIRTFLKANRPA